MGVEQELELVKYLSSPVDILHILQDDRNGVCVNRICHDTDVTL